MRASSLMVHTRIIPLGTNFRVYFVINFYKKAINIHFELQLRYQVGKLKLRDTWPSSCCNRSSHVLLERIEFMVWYEMNDPCGKSSVFYVSFGVTVYFPLIYHFRFLTICRMISACYPQSAMPDTAFAISKNTWNDYTLMNRWWGSTFCRS